MQSILEGIVDTKDVGEPVSKCFGEWKWVTKGQFVMGLGEKNKMKYYKSLFISTNKDMATSEGASKRAKLNIRDDLSHLTSEEVGALYTSTSGDAAIACINLSGDINIGMAIRVASNFGISEVHILGRKRYDKRGAVGMHCYVPTQFHSTAKGHHRETLDIPATVGELKTLEEKYTLVFVEQSPRSVPLCGFRTLHGEAFEKKPPLFIMGNEGDGIASELIEGFPSAVLVEIPQRGVCRSYNVLSALSMVLWEYFREEI